MSLGTPKNQQYHSYWGQYADPANLPNGDDNPISGGEFNKLQRGDRAFSQSDGKLYLCDNPGSDGGSDAIWRQIVSTEVPGSGGVETARVKDDSTQSVSGASNVVLDEFFTLTEGTYLVSWYHELINNDVADVALSTTVEVTPDGVPL